MPHSRVAISIFLLAMLGNPAPALSAPTDMASLRRYLHAYVHQSNVDIRTVRFAVAPLSNTGLLAVYMQDQQFCGTSGCGILLLKPKGRSFRQVDDIGGCWPPFKILPQSHHGMPDIGIWIQGGGVLPGYQTSVRFNGKHYAYRQGFPPTHRIKRDVGRILIRDETPLYPVDP
jgi:hypothetical protein